MCTSHTPASWWPPLSKRESLTSFRCTQLNDTVYGTWTQVSTTRPRYSASCRTTSDSASRWHGCRSVFPKWCENQGSQASRRFAMPWRLFALLFWLWKAMEGIHSRLPRSSAAYWLLHATEQHTPWKWAAFEWLNIMLRAHRLMLLQWPRTRFSACALPSNVTLAVLAGTVVVQLRLAIVAQSHGLQETSALVPISCRVVDPAVSWGKVFWLTHQVCHMPISIDCWMQSLTVCILVSVWSLLCDSPSVPGDNSDLLGVTFNMTIVCIKVIKHPHRGKPALVSRFLQSLRQGSVNVCSYLSWLFFLNLRRYFITFN